MKIKSLKLIIDEEIVKNERFQEGIILANWEELFGKFSKKMSLLYLKDKTIYVGIADSAMLHFMSMNKQKFIKKINDLFSEDLVENINFKLKSL